MVFSYKSRHKSPRHTGRRIRVAAISVLFLGAVGAASSAQAAPLAAPAECSAVVNDQGTYDVSWARPPDDGGSAIWAYVVKVKGQAEPVVRLEHADGRGHENSTGEHTWAGPVEGRDPLTFQVRAVNADGFGEWCETAVDGPAPPEGAPGGDPTPEQPAAELRAVDENCGLVTVSYGLGPDDHQPVTFSVLIDGVVAHTETLRSGDTDTTFTRQLAPRSSGGSATVAVQADGEPILGYEVNTHCVGSMTLEPETEPTATPGGEPTGDPGGEPTGDPGGDPGSTSTSTTDPAPTTTPTPTGTGESTPPGPAPEPGAPFVAYGEDSFLQSELTGAPIDAAMTTEFRNFITSHPDQDAPFPQIRGVDGNEWGMAYAEGSAADPVWKLTGNVPAESALLQTQGFHAPEWLGDVLTGSSDSPFVVMDRATGITLWGANAVQTGPHTIQVSAAGYFEHSSNGLDQRNPLSDSDVNFRSRGVIPDSMVIRKDAMDHAIANNTDLGYVLEVFLVETDSSAGHVSPMVGEEGGKSGWGAEGTRIAIDPSIDLEARSCSAEAEVIAKTLQNYGGYIGDNSGSGTGLKAEQENSSHPVWAGALQRDELQGCVTWDDFVVIQPGWQ